MSSLQESDSPTFRRDRTFHRRGALGVALLGGLALGLPERAAAGPVSNAVVTGAGLTAYGAQDAGVFIGERAGAGATGAGVGIVNLGASAGLAAQYGDYHIGVGYAAANSVAGAYNAAYGVSAGSRVSGFDNIALGTSAGSDVRGVAAYNGGQAAANYAIGAAAGTNVAGVQNQAFGWNAGQSTTGYGNLALGTRAGLRTSGENNIAIGTNSGFTISGSHNVSVGEAAGRALVPLAGADTADWYWSGAADAAQYNAFLGAYAGQGVTGNGNVGVGLGSLGDVTGVNNSGIGTLAAQYIAGNDNAGVGTSASNVVTGSHNYAFGYRAGNFVSGDENLALGAFAGSGVNAARTIAIGRSARATSDDAVALGTSALASGAGAIAIGNGAQNFIANSVLFGQTGAPMRLRNVAAGIADDDAVNLAQLHALSSAVRSLVDGVAADVATVSGTVNGLVPAAPANPVPPVDASFPRGVAVGGGAFTANGDAVALGNGAQTTGADSVALGAGSRASDPRTVSVGAPGSERRVVNLAPGVARTDAATMGQLQDYQATTDLRVARLDARIADTRQAAMSGVAVAMAQSSTQGASVPGGGTTIGIGSGGYGGAAAFGIGLAGNDRENTRRFAVSTAIAPGTSALGVQAGLQFRMGPHARPHAVEAPRAIALDDADLARRGVARLLRIEDGRAYLVLAGHRLYRITLAAERGFWYALTEPLDAPRAAPRASAETALLATRSREPREALLAALDAVAT